MFQDFPQPSSSYGYEKVPIKCLFLNLNFNSTIFKKVQDVWIPPIHSKIHWQYYSHEPHLRFFFYLYLRKLESENWEPSQIWYLHIWKIKTKSFVDKYQFHLPKKTNHIQVLKSKKILNFNHSLKRLRKHAQFFLDTILQTIKKLVDRIVYWISTAAPWNSKIIIYIKNFQKSNQNIDISSSGHEVLT